MTVDHIPKCAVICAMSLNLHESDLKEIQYFLSYLLRINGSLSPFFLVHHHDDDEVDDIRLSCLHAVLSLLLATASLYCIFRRSKSSLMFSIHFFAC